MGEIPECSGRTEKPVPCSGDSGKRGPEVVGRDHPKDDQRKCSGIKHLWRCGTNWNRSTGWGYPGPDDGFPVSDGKYVKGVRPMIVRYIHCWIC